ncbi:DNA-binding MarR family transcriptional regulator [Kineosphaera limosa]|uniref:Putative MarR family transcriptional regulator n=1 Tax=Kineosphaera limosa NBRC 100340 TaxID=1184609 RepID=K6WT49_9MICO|nr:MarR family transcriptional regulator [Kineosphaera limosa]NYE02132.1 DNA-binding MarR family transcriptional regulator [Kineosphaera limosa]GAB95267.1 putative MarR family transcriptional regulator [Kineosphaera limosa NBRC 100340]
MAAIDPQHPVEHDEVDRIVQAWQRVAPQLPVEPLHVLSRISRFARHLDRARKEAFSRHHLEVWEFDVMSALRRAGAPYELSPGILVQQTLSTSGTMTNRIDRLERRGLVERHRDPSDRRGVKVRLTATGCEVVDSALHDLLEREHDLLAHLPQAERTHLADSLRLLLAPLEPDADHRRSDKRHPD